MIFCYKKVLSLIAFIAVFMLYPIFALGGVGSVGVRPLSFDLELVPGEKREFEITLFSSIPKEESKVRLSLYDATQKLDGTCRFVKPGANPYSCASWLKFDKTDVIVPGGEEKQVKVTLKVPRGQKGFRFVAVMVEPESGPAPERGVQIRIRYAIMVRLNIKSVRAPEKAGIESLTLSNADGMPLICAGIKNECRTAIETQGSVAIRDADRRLIERVPLYALCKVKERDPLCRIYPGAVVGFTGKPAKPLKPGSYTLWVHIKYGERGYLSKKKDITVNQGDFTYPGLSGGKIDYQVKPVVIKARIPAGGSKYTVLNIKNNEEVPLAFRINPAPYPGGEKSPFSCLDWIIIEDREFSVEPRTSRRVPVIIKVPEGVEGSRYASISIDAYSPDTGATSHCTTDVLALIPGEVKRLATIKRFECNIDAGEVRVSLLNTGNIHIIPEGDVIITDIYNNKIETVKLKSRDRIIIPGSEGLLTGELRRKLTLGDYRAGATIEYGGKEKAVADLKFKAQRGQP